MSWIFFKFPSQGKLEFSRVPIWKNANPEVPQVVNSSAVFGIEKSFSILSVHIEIVGFAFDIEK